ncbi:MAG: RNA methyltransferase [Halobacteriales archaeon]
MSEIAVAIVDAETPGNIGTIARAMKNFGCEELLLVDPPPLDPDGEAFGLAGQARKDILPNRREITFDTLVEQYYTVGFTAYPNEDDRKHVRYPVVTPAELATELASVTADTALVFGRERVGLSNDELARLDRCCSIPAADSYPVLNLGQAATITLYELRSLLLEETQHPEDRHSRAEEAQLERLYATFGEFLAAINHPAEKRAKAGRMLRRLMGRAHPTGREAVTLTGILRRAAQRIDNTTDEKDA